MPNAIHQVVGVCAFGILLVGAIACGRINKTNGPDEYVVEEATFTTPIGTEHHQVLVPAGPFEMGSSDGKADEFPVHEVEIDAFYIDKYEVTNALYMAYVADTGASEPQFIRESAYNQPDQPVVGVLWIRARDYCLWAGMDLPTEAQWEKAARGIDERTYPWGDETPETDLTNFNLSDGPAIVGSFPAGTSPYGAMDMSGNVWEWTLDKYEFTYYARSPKSNPVNLDISGLASGPDRTLRGGGWISSGYSVRVAVRSSIYMLQEQAQQRDAIETSTVYAAIGFRCIRPVSSP